jgi:hypothetical protein
MSDEVAPLSCECTDWLTPWSRVLLENLMVIQRTRSCPTFYGIQRFIMAFALPLFPILSHMIQSTPSHAISPRSFQILPTHLRPGLPSGLLPSGFPTKNLYAFLISYLHLVSMLRMGGAIPPFPQQEFMVRCLVKHREFTLPYCTVRMRAVRAGIAQSV